MSPYSKTASGFSVSSTASGTITSPIIAKGFNTTGGNSGNLGGGLGTFTYNLSGLVAGTQYSVTAYATNDCGDTQEVSTTFTTLAAPVCTNPTVATISISFNSGGTWNGRLDNLGTPNPSSDIISLGFEYSSNNFATIAGFVLASEASVSSYYTPFSFFQYNPNIQTRPLYVRAVAIRGNCKGIGGVFAII